MGRKSDPSILYMVVAADEYELPLAVADTTTELAKMYRMKRSTINSAIYHEADNGHVRGYKFIKVKLDEEGD